MTSNRRLTCLAALLAVLLAGGLLWRPVLSMSEGLWGSANPWGNGDFIGAYWLFWSAWAPGDWVSQLAWPHGEGSLLVSFPNPFDAWILGPVMAWLPFPLGWNGMMLGHHLANVAATVVLARSAGAKVLPAAAAGALVGASPVMLLETGLGHTLTAAVWPGLLGLALLLRGRAVGAGLLIGLQGLCYLYTGLGFGLAALLLRPQRGLMVAMLVIAPYLLYLWPMLPVADAIDPPASHTSLPLDALFWGSQQQHFRIHPLLLLGWVAPLMRSQEDRAKTWRWVGVAGLTLFVAIGPSVAWERGTAIFTSPLAWMQYWTPGLGRMHHPIRFAMILVPALAVGTALAVHRWPRLASAVLLLSVLPTWKVIDDTCEWPEDPTPPGAEAAAWLAQHEGGVVDLGSRSMEALALQTIHRRPVLSGFHPRQAPRPGIDPEIFRRVDAWADGIPQAGLPLSLRQLGFTHVLIVERGPQAPVDASAVEAALGAPVHPGVYAL